MNYLKLEKIITSNGWILVRIMGSSRQYRKLDHKNTVIIANLGNGRVSVDVLTNLEKKTGLSLKR